MTQQTVIIDTSWYQAGLSGREWTCLLKLASTAKDLATTPATRQRDLATELGTSERVVSKAIAGLIRKGCVDVHQRGVSAKGEGNVYTLIRA